MRKRQQLEREAEQQALLPDVPELHQQSSRGIMPMNHPALAPEAGHIQRFDTLNGRPISSLLGNKFALE